MQSDIQQVHPDKLHRTRLVYHGVLREIAQARPIANPAKPGEFFPLSIAIVAYQDFYRNLYHPSTSIEAMVDREFLHAVIQMIEAHAASGGVKFAVKEDERRRA